MSHFAEINNENKVIRVLVGDNSMPNEGHDWFVENFGGTWIKTSRNAATNGFRKNYAGEDYTYDSIRDAFIPPKTFDSWLLNEETCLWEAPTPRPIDENMYTWDESSLDWKVIS